MNKKLTKAFSSDVTVSDGERAVTARISTAVVDREGDVLVPAGCNARDFLANPVVFLNHSYWSLPVGQCAALRRDEDAIIAKTVFATRPDDFPEGQEWIPDTLLSLFQQGVIRAFSVGFEIIESRPANTRDVEKYGEGCRRVISKWKVYEYSVAPMPCNQEAITLAVSKGLIKADMALKVWGVEPKAKDEKSDMACDDCGEMYPEDQLSMVDGERICKKCMEARKSVEPKHVVATIETAPPEVHEVKHIVAAVETGIIPEVSVRHVHRILPDQPFITEAKVRRLVVAQLSKMRGQIYV